MISLPGNLVLAKTASILPGFLKIISTFLKKINSSKTCQEKSPVPACSFLLLPALFCSCLFFSAPVCTLQVLLKKHRV